MSKILVVEDDLEMGALIERGLVGEGHTVVLVGNGVDALIAVSNDHFAAAAIDVMLPQMSGFEVCRRIRESGSTLPIILLTARDAIEDRVTGLDLGADDYLTKPFAFAELNARLRAHLRRENTLASAVISIGDVLIDPGVVRASVRGKALSLSVKEFALLRLLASKPGRVFSRPEILDEVWGSSVLFDNTLVDQYVSYLRKKLGTSTARVMVTTIRGAGYRIDELQSADRA